MPHSKMPDADRRPLASQTVAANSVANTSRRQSVRQRATALLLGLSNAALSVLALTLASQHGYAAGLPAIRIDNTNRVPSCVTPERLMAFLTKRNPQLDPRFRDIAKWYRHHGQAWRVRWDFAFFQMALETNYLSFRRPDGQRGDVDPRQNNFAGIGATGGGVPGDRFPDVGTGVLAQIQHLVAYSGELLQHPVAPRTALKQDVIVTTSRKLNRPVRFSDLARRWAADARYASSIASLADGFYAAHCPAREAAGFKRLGTVKPTAPTLPGAAPHMQHLLGAADAARLALPPARRLAKTPPSKPTATRTVVRTIWQRGQPPAEPQVAASTATPPTVMPEVNQTNTPSAMLPGLAALARNIEMPIVAPRPQLALRQGR